jgi:hypothetical protein
LVSASFDFLSTDGDDLVHGAIADDLAHDGFGNIAQGFARLANLEKELDRVRDAVLNHPFHQRGVQVTGHHLRFPLAVLRARTLVRIAGAWGCEAEFLFQLALDRNDGRRIHAEGQLEMQPRFDVLEILSKALDDRDRVARYGEIGCPCENEIRRLSI